MDVGVSVSVSVSVQWVGGAEGWYGLLASMDGQSGGVSVCCESWS